MGVIQSFERRLQGAVGNTFARLFGGKVQPAEVADALQREADEHIQRQGNSLIAPNHYRVRLGPTDRRGLGSDEVSVASALSDMIREYLDEQGWQTFGDVAVSLEQSESLHTGQFRISSIVDPDVGRQGQKAAPPQAAPPHAALKHPMAGVGRMTQQPGDSGRPDNRQDPQQAGQNDQQGQRPPDGQYPPPGYQQPGYPPPGQGYQGQPAYQGQNYPGQQNPGYPPQPYDAPGYGQRVWDQQGQQWEQQYGQQPQPGYQQPYQQGPAPQQWDQQGYGQPAYPQQGQQYPQNYGQNYGPPAGAPPEISATLSIDDGSGRTHQLVHGSNVIGRGQDAAFRLADTSVSRRHVDVYFDGRSAVLHDLGSTNGTTVNGSSVQTWQLADGDVIHIGHSTVVFSSRY
ncbi:MAG: FhaA domain-containing protein [Nakamurella sp.]